MEAGHGAQYYCYIVLLTSLRRVASYRFLVVTGPRAGGRAQVVRGLETADQQLLDLAADTADTSQRRFESRILHTLVWGCSRDRVAALGHCKYR